MRAAIDVLRFLDEANCRGQRTALVAIARVIGSSSRNPGALLAVSEGGAWCGSLSGGCVEAAVVGEAQRAMDHGQAELLRLGVASPLIDIRLPCGGGLDLLILPDPDPQAVAEALSQLARRQTVALSIGLDGSLVTSPAQPSARADWNGEVLTVRLDPVLRIVAIGQGEEVMALSRMGVAYGTDMVVLTPDSSAVDRLAAIGARAHHLRTQAPSPDLETDAATAVIFLFHDHDWEQALLRQALDQTALFIGAMGSRRTQALRLETMRALGVSEPLLTRIEGPIGLIPMTRDPDTLALSVLGQVAAAYQAHCDRLLDEIGNRMPDRTLGTLSAS